MEHEIRFRLYPTEKIARLVVYEHTPLGEVRTWLADRFDVDLDSLHIERCHGADTMPMRNFLGVCHLVHEMLVFAKERVAVVVQ